MCSAITLTPIDGMWGLHEPHTEEVVVLEYDELLTVAHLLIKAYRREQEKREMGL